MPVDEAVPESESSRDLLPSFELSYTLDYEENPTRVILYKNDDPDVTHWLSIDIEYAIDLGEVA